MAKALSVLVAAIMATAASPTAALSVEDLRAMWELPVDAAGGVARRVLELLPAKWATGTAPAELPEDFFPPPMPLELEGEAAVRTYPAFPHAPLLVAAAGCDGVVLRWKSFDDDRWPVDAFVLQRFPDMDARPQWEILSNSNASELVDERVLPGYHYTYRVQAISSDVESAYAYHWTRVQSLQASESSARSGWLAPMHSMAHRHSDALRTIGLICACFLTVYGLMRANVKSVQGTRARSYRLKRIKKSTSEGVAAAAAAAKPQAPRRSSSSSTASPASALMDSARSNSVDEMVAAAERNHRASVMTTTRESTAEDPAAAAAAEPPFRRQAQSLSSARVSEKAEYCQDCRKRFGIFRRRHLCDICHSVTLCRKCGFQAPVETYNGRRSSTASSAASAQRKLKIRTICRNCCDDVYRYSTAPGVRPSVPHHALSA